MVEIELGQVQETLLMPLWARAVESRKADPILRDEAAIELVDRIDYDFSRFEGARRRTTRSCGPSGPGTSTP